jgi:hypothetical protein
MPQAAASRPPQSSRQDATRAARQYKPLASYSSPFSSDASRSPVRDFLSVEIRPHQRNAKATRNKNGRKTALANASNRPSRAIFSMDGFRLRRSALLTRSALFDAIKIGYGGRQDLGIMGFLNCRLSSTSCRLNLQHEVDPVTPIHRKFLGASDLRELFLIIDPTAQGVLSGPRWHVRGDG